jgi:DNA-binding MarR family transcriptional regulator
MAESIDQTAEQFLELLQKFVQLRPKLIISQEIKDFKKQMEKLKSSASGFEKHQLFRVLVIIAQSPAPPTMGDLSAQLEMPLSSSTRIMDGLVSAGFVERVNDQHDRRVVRIQMTKTGQELFQTALRYNKQRVLHILGKFTPDEQIQLLKLMTKLYDSLLAENESA